MMFSERHTSSLLKRGNCNGRSNLEIEKYLEQMSKAGQFYFKIDDHVPSDIRKETILWMMMQARIIGLERSSFYKAVDLWDLILTGELQDNLEMHKLVGVVALRVEETIALGFERSNREQWFEEYFPGLSEEYLADMEERLIQFRIKIILPSTADKFLDDLVSLIGDSTESSEQNKTVLEMREVLDLCIIENRYRMYAPLALAAGIYFWYCRGAQAPWLHFLSSMCPDLLQVVDWVAPKVKIVNERKPEMQ